MESNSFRTISFGICARIMICIRFFAICLAVSFLPDPACRAATIRVPADQPTIQAGIDAAAAGDIVLVADGTYTGDGNRDIDFKGKAITVTSENGPENCIIDCEGSDTDWHRGFIFQSGSRDRYPRFRPADGRSSRHGSAVLRESGAMSLRVHGYLFHEREI